MQVLILVTIDTIIRIIMMMIIDIDSSSLIRTVVWRSGTLSKDGRQCDSDSISEADEKLGKRFQSS